MSLCKNNSAEISSTEKELNNFNEDKKDIKQRFDLLLEQRWAIPNKSTSINRKLLVCLDGHIESARKDLKDTEVNISSKIKRLNELSIEGKCTPERIAQLIDYIEKLNGFSLGGNEDVIDKFIKNFSIAKTEINGDIQAVNQEVDSVILKELNKKEQDLKNLDDLSVTGIFDRILDGKNNSEFILIVFFACLGDIVPVLISLKHRNPNTFNGLLENMVVWFHDLADEIGEIKFIPTVSKAA